MSGAERVIQQLNAEGRPPASLEALSRLLPRAEAVASSRIEGPEVGGRRLMSAETARMLGVRARWQAHPAIRESNRQSAPSPRVHAEGDLVGSAEDVVDCYEQIREG